MKFKKIINLFAIIIIATLPIITISCSSSNNTNSQIKPEQENNKIDLNTITSINRDSFKELWYKHPSLFQNNTLNLSFLPNLETIENDTFMLDDNLANSNSKISKIIFNNKLKTIGNNAFKNIKSLKELNLPFSIEHLGNNSFDSAFIDGFSKLIFNKNHKSSISLGNQSFSNNKNLTLFVIQNETLKTTIENIKQYIGYNSTILSDDLDSSGEIDGLTISKFLPIVSILELTKQTRLSSLSNEILNNKIKNNQEIQKNPIYKNTNFEIQNGSSESLGILKLKININSPSNNFNNNENIIEITGFEKIYNKDLILESIKIDSHKYFEDLQKEENLKSWSNNQWKKYLSEIKVRTKDWLESFNLAEQNQSSNINIEFKYYNEENKNTIYLTSTITNNEYKNNAWVESEKSSPKEIKGYNLKPINFKLPNKKEDLFGFLNSKVKINEEKRNELITNTFASKYLSNFRINIKTWPNNLLLIDEKYKKYSKELGLNKINIEVISVYPNDVDGILYFDYKIKDEDNTSNQFMYLSSYQIDGFKKINNLFLKQPIININRSNETLKNRFIKKIQEIKSKNELIDLCNKKETIQIPNLGINGYGKDATTDINTKNIVLDNWEKGESSNSKLFETSSTKFQFDNSIFQDKQLISNNIDFSTNLFNQEFIINYFDFTTNMTNNAELIGINSQTFKYESNIEIKLLLNKSSINYENNHEYKINAKLILTLHISDFK